MLTYSVWNDAKRGYDYYQAPGVSTTHAPTPAQPSGSSVLGATPEEASWRLPRGARKVGEGPVARGRIASLGGTSSAGQLPQWIVYAAAGLIAWRVLR